MRDIVIFGAGKLGKRAIMKYGEKNIAFVIDNNIMLQGKMINNLIIRKPEYLQSIKNEYIVIIASRQKKSMEKQLISMGISNYMIYSEKKYMDIPELIYNPYDEMKISSDDSQKIEDINSEVEELMKDGIKLFDHIEIETINRCNGVCEFCPVNRNVDTRELHIMSEHLFYSIIDQLEKISYNGKIALFSNNEPLLDDRILKFHRYMREHLPYARTHLCTNGTLLTIDKFIELTEYLDELMIDNYNQELKLIEPCKRIVEYCESHKELKEKVTIILRKPMEVLTNRGGDAPNAKEYEQYSNASCMLPFKQLIVRPDGKVSLCCNDALGKCTLGDLNKETLEEVWFGDRFGEARKILSKGRSDFERCKSCNTLFLC